MTRLPGTARDIYKRTPTIWTKLVGTLWPTLSPARTEPPGSEGLRAFFPTWVYFPNVSSTCICWSQRSTERTDSGRGCGGPRAPPAGCRTCPPPWPATAHHKPFVWSPWPFFFWDRPVLLVLDQEKNTPFRFRSLSSSRSSFRDRPDLDFPVSCRQVENGE